MKIKSKSKQLPEMLCVSLLEICPSQLFISDELVETEDEFFAKL